MTSSKPLPRSALTYQEACHYVLHHVGHPGDWLAPGSFFEQLIRAAFAADDTNLARIGGGFPMVWLAVHNYRIKGPDRLAVEADS